MLEYCKSLPVDLGSRFVALKAYEFVHLAGFSLYELASKCSTLRGVLTHLPAAATLHLYRYLALHIMSQESGQSATNVYQSCDPAYLRQLREQAGMDLHVLAKTACLSLAQVRELEQGSETGVFYSVSIRRQAYKRLLLILGAEPPSAEPIELPMAARQEHQTQLQNLDQIAAMSRLPTVDRSVWTPLLGLAHWASERKQTVASGALLLVAGALLVWHWPQGGSQAVVSSVSQAASAATAAASESAAAVEAALNKPAASEPVVATVANAPAVVTSAPAKPASVPTPAAAPAAADNPAKCAFSSEALPQVTAMSPSKAGRYVHFVSTANVELCVVDGSKQVTTLNLKAGESRSVYGVSPWQVSSASLGKVQVFFQGWRVMLPSDATQRMTLVEKPVSP